MPDDDNEQKRIEVAEQVRCDHGNRCPIEDCGHQLPHQAVTDCRGNPCNKYPGEKVQCIPVSSYDYYMHQLDGRKGTMLGELMRDRVMLLAVLRSQPGVLQEVLTEMAKMIPVLPRREDYLHTEAERCNACGKPTPGDCWCNECRPPDDPRTDEEIADYLGAIEEAHEAERMQRDGNVTFAIRERKDHVDGQADKDD